MSTYSNGLIRKTLQECKSTYQEECEGVGFSEKQVEYLVELVAKDIVRILENEQRWNTEPETNPGRAEAIVEIKEYFGI